MGSSASVRRVAVSARRWCHTWGSANRMGSSAVDAMSHDTEKHVAQVHKWPIKAFCRRSRELAHLAMDDMGRRGSTKLTHVRAWVSSMFSGRMERYIQLYTSGDRTPRPTSANLHGLTRAVLWMCEHITSEKGSEGSAPIFVALATTRSGSPSRRPTALYMYMYMYNVSNKLYRTIRYSNK